MLLWIDENEWDTRRVKARKIGLYLVYIWFMFGLLVFLLLLHRHKVWGYGGEVLRES